MKKKFINRLSIAFWALVLVTLASCGESVEPTSTGTGGVCSIASITSSDGYAIGYSYNSEQKISKVNLTGDKVNTTFTLTYDKTKGTLTSIANPNNSSLTVLTYDNDNFLVGAVTTIAKKDGGIILGKPATITNFRNEMEFEWGVRNQLKTQFTRTTSTVTVNGVSEEFSYKGFLTYEYDITTNELRAINSYSVEELILGGKVVLSPGSLDATYDFVYESDIVEALQKTGPGLIELNIDFVDDGQVVFTPKSKKAVKTLYSVFYDDNKEVIDDSEINYTNTKNASGLLSKAVVVDKYGSETIAYSYNNCK
jgi:hypothetical protein